MTTTPTTCRWFALCDRPAIGTVGHPAFPDGVAICARCASRMELEDRVRPFAGRPVGTAR